MEVFMTGANGFVGLNTVAALKQAGHSVVAMIRPNANVAFLEPMGVRIVHGQLDDVDALTAADALKLGLAQAFSLIPGTSRSGATIIGGMLFGLSRRAATEFSFFLAIPTLFAACAYESIRNRELLAQADLAAFGTGFAAAFVSAFMCVRWLLRYVSQHDFTPFAWYRIAFGLVILVTAWTGVVRWD